MTKLEDTSNLGKVIADKLRQAEILDIETLRELGSEAAFTRIITIEPEVGCPQMLYALEGAIQGVRWHHLEKEKKQELKEFYDFVSKKR